MSDANDDLPDLRAERLRLLDELKRPVGDKRQEIAARLQQVADRIRELQVPRRP